MDSILCMFGMFWTGLLLRGEFAPAFLFEKSLMSLVCPTSSSLVRAQRHRYRFPRAKVLSCLLRRSVTRGGECALRRHRRLYHGMQFDDHFNSISTSVHREAGADHKGSPDQKRFCPEDQAFLYGNPGQGEALDRNEVFSERNNHCRRPGRSGHRAPSL